MGPTRMPVRSLRGHRGAVKSLVQRLWKSWATRSLAIGAGATVIDIGVGLLCVTGLGLATRIGAMLGVAVGATFCFFMNRYFAFREHNPQLASPAAKFIVATAASMVIHGQFVVMLRDHFGVPFVVSKMIADVGVFSLGQLLVLRYLVFPKAKPSHTQPRLALEPAPSVEGR